MIVFINSPAIIRRGAAAVVTMSIMAVFISCAGRGILETTVNKRFLPEGYSLTAPQSIRAEEKGISVVLYSRGFAQGDAVYAEITGSVQTLRSASVSFNGRMIPVVEKLWGCRSLFCIPPEMKEGKSPVTVRCETGRGQVKMEIPVNVVSGKFLVEKTPLDLGAFSDNHKEISKELQAFIDKCTESKKKVWAEVLSDRLSSNLAHPRDMHYITSEFYSKRVYEQYNIVNGKRVRAGDKTKVHWGLDFRGDEGTPVYAMARGHVSLSARLHYEGNMIILDHGNGIFTYYMHMAGRTVKEGDEVRAGQLIGKVGSTGMSTGSHLHVSFFLNKEHADPLSILWLPIRE
jgi:hypothetical protein